jgi:hypothetical protein
MSQHADLLIRGGPIYTLDPRQPRWDRPFLTGRLRVASGSLYATLTGPYRR